MHTVFDAFITLTATTLPGTALITAQGQIKPVHAFKAPVIVALDYVDSLGNVTTHLVSTNLVGAFSDTFSNPNPLSWHVRGIWQGDMIWSSAVSPLVSVTATANVYPYSRIRRVPHR